MDTMGSSADNIWAAYLEETSGTTSRKEIAAAMSRHTESTIAASTVSNWFSGKHQPTVAAHVAAFALAYKRNPLEAFVIARLLDLEHAAAGLNDEELARITRLRAEFGGDVEFGSATELLGADSAERGV
jgi:hypothetical protein